MRKDVCPIAGVIVAALVACLPGAASGSPSPVVYPPAAARTIFRHDRHATVGAACTYCHVDAASSARASDRLAVGEGVCATCHPNQKVEPTAPSKVPAGAASVIPPGVPSLAPPLKFSHRLHVAQGTACVSCHAEGALDGPEHEGLPAMEACLACHDGKRASARCSACHPSKPDGRLETVWPSGKLVPLGSWAGAAAHGPSFRQHHETAARNEKRCDVCHTRSFCTDCHGEGVVRPGFLHPANYVDLHALEARRNVPDCSACHRSQTFCVSCHQRLGVAPDATGGEPGRRAANPFGTGTGLKSFHPPGWVGTSQGGSGHARQARLSVTTCVSCHREESCLACHSTDVSHAFQVSPHGPAFAGTAKCRALASRNQRVCLKCHAPGLPELDCR